MAFTLEGKFSRIRSKEVFLSGQAFIPGGVSSPGRAFSEVNEGPFVVAKANGKYLHDVDGNRYTDFICGLGPAILGHGNAEVAAAITEQFKQGSVYGVPNEIEFQLAEYIVGTSRYLDKIRFTCSGTEATMTALRIARAHTGKHAILKFNGGYHGHSDTLLTGATKQHMIPSGGMIVRNGISSSSATITYLADFNDIASVNAAFEKAGSEIAAIIIEPVPSNIGVIPPQKSFLQHLRNMADEHGVVLIFDEVVSGFRHRMGPVADVLGVRPDLITFGKIIGGGLPVGAFGGREELMSLLISKGSVFQGGTFAGSPLTMAAGLAQLRYMESQGIHERVAQLGERLSKSLQQAFRGHGLPFSAQHFGSLVTPILVPDCVSLCSYQDVKHQDEKLFSKMYPDLLRAGFAVPPTIEEPVFISACHDENDIDVFAREYAITAAKHYAAD